VLSPGRRPLSRFRARRGVAAWGAVAAALFLAACHFPGTSGSGQPPAGSSITVASVPGIGDAPLYIALHQGLFRQAGLSVTVRSYPSVTAEAAALRAGQADVAVGDYANFFYAQETGTRAPLVVVADGYDAGPGVMEVLVLPGSGITSPQDLAGKSIGTAAPDLIPHVSNDQPYSLETVAASSVLMNDGVQPSAVTWKPMPAADLAGALRTHRVDSILVTEPEISQVENELGAQSVLDACSGETVNLPLDGYFATASYASRHRAALLAFRSALTRAQTDAAQAGPVQAVLTQYAGMSRQTASLVTVGVYPTSLRVSSLQRVANLMSFYGALPHPLNVGQTIMP
jgi:NitT/TauT family transport system substrate-binding protein